MQLKVQQYSISRVSNFLFVTFFWYQDDIQAGQNIWRILLESLKSGIIKNMEDYHSTKSNTELVANVSFLSIVEDHSPP